MTYVQDMTQLGFSQPEDTMLPFPKFSSKIVSAPWVSYEVKEGISQQRRSELTLRLLGCICQRQIIALAFRLHRKSEGEEKLGFRIEENTVYLAHLRVGPQSHGSFYK